MCSRYFLDADGNVIAYTFRVPADDRVRKRYNIAPSQEAPVVRAAHGGGRELAWLRWGLVPYWAKDPSIGSRMINARSETAMEKPAFREAFRARRCAIPASGFYEWTGEAKHRIPHAIRVEGRPLVAFAGLWERWKDAQGTRIETYTILTTPANGFVSPMHDRMPAILAEADIDAWLSGSIEDARKLLRPYPEEAMRERVVSRALNNPRNEFPEVWAAGSDAGEGR
ncbi:MAG TPA: SOS response-associated peptidase [Usitatibacter sp.]|nr:SOS response-associated peptidase [Usitatibacter sp.]